MLNANDPLAIALKNAEAMAERIARLNDLLAVIDYRLAKHTSSVLEHSENVNQLSKCLECTA